MKKIYFVSILILSLIIALVFSPQTRAFVYALLPASFWTKEMAYAQIKDICHPTLKDYFILQKYLLHGKRPGIAALKDTAKRASYFRFINKSATTIPSLQILSLDVEKENCILLYSSLNRRFPLGLKRLLECISASDFKGDILYRIGGWPNVEEGDLTLASVPYAFKVCFFKEAKKLGYKRALWLDCSIIPVASLNAIFKHIEKTGYFCMGNSHTVGPFFNEKAACSLGISLEESFQIPSCSAGLLGIDFCNEKAAKILTEWECAAKDPFAFFSPRSDQNALSVILYKLGCQEFAPISTLAHRPADISSDTLFLIDRSFVGKGKK